MSSSFSKKALKRLILSRVEEGKSTITPPMNREPMNISEIGFKYDKFLGYKAYFVQLVEKLLHQKFLIHKFNNRLIYDVHRERVLKIRDKHQHMVTNEPNHFLLLRLGVVKSGR